MNSTTTATSNPMRDPDAGVRCMLMRGGSSKGAYFLADDLPAARDERDDLLRRIMGSPDPRQIDGLGGAHPLTSKVAVVSPSPLDGVDVDYLFLQVGVDTDIVSDQQNCGNILAGVAPFAVERGLVKVDPAATEVEVSIRMINTDSVVLATLAVQAGRPVTDGDTAIAGVPGTAAAIRLDFADVAGSSTGALLPTGNVVDIIDGTPVTLIDNGMPVVVMLAEDLDVAGVTGDEPCEALEANTELRAKLERIRLAAGPLMHLGDVTHATVPKLTIVSSPTIGGDINTRTFIPHRCHDAIGVLGAVSVATAALLPGSPAYGLLDTGTRRSSNGVVIEHPTGTFDVVIDGDFTTVPPQLGRVGIVRTARKIMDGLVFPRSVSTVHSQEP